MPLYIMARMLLVILIAILIRTPVSINLKMVWYFVFMVVTCIFYPDRRNQRFYYAGLITAIIFAPVYVIWGAIQRTSA